MPPEPRDVIRTGSELVLSSGDWITPNDVTSGLVVLVHGFTSHGRYLVSLANFFQGYGLCAAIFNYDSYLGIDTAASDLGVRLNNLKGPLQKHGFALVAHSMGGLVVRELARKLDTPFREALKGIALLGTPNKGAFKDNKMIGFMLDWGDFLTDPNPYARHLPCRSAEQLTNKDGDGLIHSLNELDSTSPLPIPMLSISGGRPYLEFGKGSQLAAALRTLSRFDRNRILQNMINETPNDGLVPESSADLTKVLSVNDSIVHQNSYSDYWKTNHTNLTQNQEVAGVIVRWLLDVVKLPPR